MLFLQNHDQIGNRAFGERLHHLADPRALRAATVLLLLSPMIPLMFMGDEYAAAQPFLFFTSHHGELAELVREGRRNEFPGSPRLPIRINASRSPTRMPRRPSMPRSPD